MALIKYGGGIVQMSGSMAGNTFARNRFGNYVRSRTKPVNPQSARQQVIRGAMSQLVTRWGNTLSPAQRTAWALYASSVAVLNRLGETVYLTGMNHYVRSNTWRLDLGQTIIDAGPTTFELPETDGSVTVTASEATQLVTINFNDGLDWCTEDNAGIMIIEGSPQNVQREFFNGPWRGRSAKMGADPGGIASPQTYAAIHVITEGQKLWVRFRIIRADGRLSNTFRNSCTIGA